MGRTPGNASGTQDSTSKRSTPPGSK
jgi:hypothetical protein